MRKDNKLLISNKVLDTLYEDIDNGRYGRSGNWLPTPTEISRLMRKNAETSWDFALWIIETYDGERPYENKIIRLLNEFVEDEVEFMDEKEIKKELARREREKKLAELDDINLLPSLPVVEAVHDIEEADDGLEATEIREEDLEEEEPIEVDTLGL